MGMAPEATTDDSDARGTARDDLCECYMARGLSGDSSICAAVCEYKEGEIRCSRPDGHDGPHAACGTALHPIETWNDEDDR